jgi:hypothetical protein
MDDWVEAQFLEVYSAKDGRLNLQAFNREAFRQYLWSQRPKEVEAVTTAVSK